MALRFATAGFRQGRRTQHKDGMRPHIVQFGHSAADGLHKHLDPRRRFLLVRNWRPAVQLCCDDQTLFALEFHGKSSATARSQRRVAVLDRSLDILSTMIPSADNDYVLQPAGEKKLPLAEKPKIAGPEKGPLARVSEPRTEYSLAFFRSLKIAAGDAFAGDPNFSNLLRLTRDAAFRINNQNLGSGDCLSTVDQFRLSPLS